MPELNAQSRTAPSLSVGTRAAALALVALMAIGSVLMWICVPLGLVWVAAHLQHGTDPSLGPYLLIICGLPVAMVVIGKALAALDRLFSRVTGHDPNSGRAPAPWLKSMRGERGSEHKRTVLDVVMIVSVTLAGIVFLAWFFVLAHPGLPHA